MNWQFKLGVFLGSVLLIKLELLLIIMILFSGYFFPSITILFQVAAAAIAFIVIVGHIKTTVGLFNNMIDPSFMCEDYIAPTTIKEAIDIRKTQTYKGVKFRFQKEIQYIKEIANFNFKYK